MNKLESPSAVAINAFVASAFSTFGTVLGEEPERGMITVDATGKTSHQVNVIVGMTGMFYGYMAFGMSLATADKIASTMTGVPVRTFDAAAASAISELANSICKSAVTELARNGHFCDVTLPTVIKGVRVFVSAVTTPSIVVPLRLAHGVVSLSIALSGYSGALTETTAA